MNKFLLNILILILVTSAYAQQPRYDHFDVTSGLSQNNIYSLLIDSTGYIWVGTLHGLNRYNGYNFDVYKPEANNPYSLFGNTVSATCQGKNGDIWIVTRNGGLNRYHSAYEKFEHFPDSLFPGINVMGVEDLYWCNDQLWMRNQNIVGIFDTKDHTFNTYYSTNILRGFRINQNTDALIYGQWGKAILSYKNKELKAEIVSRKPTWTYSCKRQCIWLEDKHILQKQIDGTTDTLLHLNQFNGLTFNYNQINSIIRINDEIWLGGGNSLIRFHLNEKSYEKFNYDPANKYSFKGFYITTIEADQAGNVWIGTQKHGLNLYNRNKNQFKHYNWNFYPNQGMDIDPVRAICKTKSGDLWVGFDREGIGLINKKGEQTLFTYFYDSQNKKKRIYLIRHLFEDSFGNIWGCGQNELIQYNHKLNRFESIDRNHNWNWPFRSYVMGEFEPGLLMLTGGRRIGVVNLETDNLATLPMSQNNISISSSTRDITYDSYQNLWIGSDGTGIIKIAYPDLSFERITNESHGICDDKIYAFATRNDSLWIASNNGLTLFDVRQNRVLKIWNESDGLTNNIVYGLYLHQNELWMSTNKGIGFFDFKNNRFDTYLQDDYFMDDAHFVSDDGEVFYGGYNGIVSFYPSSIKNELMRSEPVVEKMFVLNERIRTGQKLDGKTILEEPLSNTTNLKLQYTHHSFSFAFNAFPFDFPNNHQFKYRLQNWQNEWIFPTSGNNIAAYNRVSPGKYIFQIAVLQNNGEWSLPKDISINIVPPFWQRLSFQIFVALLLGVIILLTVRIRIQNVKRRAVILKQRVDEQTAELKLQNEKIQEISDQLHEADQSKLRFFTNISHEFRTPLTLILGYLENISSNNLNEGVKVIRNNSLRLLRLINQLIDVRKLDQNKMKLRVSNFEMVTWLNEMVILFEHLAQRKNIKLQFHSIPTKAEVWLDVDMMEKILFNLISNAIKYSRSGDTITIYFDENDTQYLLRVCDTGIGINTNDLPNIFDRFYRSEEKFQQQAGHGIGLALAKELTELQHGSIEVESEKDRGTTFSLSFQKGKRHFTTSDFSLPKKEQFSEINPVTIAPKLLKNITHSTILIVEDNLELSEYLCDLLSNNFQTQSVSNGKEALQQITNNQPDLIISDVMMPVMDGIELCKQIKTNEQWKDIPFIMLTARTEPELKISGFDLGIDDFIEKPFHPNVLVARVNALLENRLHLKENEPILSKSESKAKKNTASKADKEFMKQVEKIVKQNYSSPTFNLDELSQLMHMSRPTFFRKFKALTVTTPADYLRKFRLEKAVKLIHEQQLNISQICTEVGFQSPSHFRKLFKAEFGKTPGEYGKGV